MAEKFAESVKEVKLATESDIATFVKERDFHEKLKKY